MNLPRTPETLTAIEDTLIQCHGSLPRTCHRLGIKPQHLQLWLSSDPEVYARIRAAQLLGYSTLEEAALKRAVDGVDEDVYFKGEVVGQKKVYSDGLLSQMLKARIPEYSNEEARTNNSLTVNVAIMPRASTYEEWVEQRERALAAPQPELPVPEGEYTQFEDTTNDKQADTVRLRDVL